MPRLCIHGAVLVLPGGERRGGVVVGDDGRIEAVLDGDARAAADTAIDARGRLLFPGFIDAHVHMREPGFTHKEDFTSGTLAAAAGGITTVLCMPNTRPAVDSFAGLVHARRTAEGRAAVDYGFQAAITRSNLADLAGLWTAGVTSFEAFMAEVPEPDRLDDAAMLRAALAEVARLGAVVGVLCASQPIVDAARARLVAAGRTDVRAVAEARPPLNETIAVAALIEAVADTGARALVRQVSAARSFALLRRAKSDPATAKMMAEVTPHNLTLDDGVLDRLGTTAQMLPPLRRAEDCAAAVAALKDGTVDWVGSDHAPHAPDEKDRTDAWTAAGGTPGLDTMAAAVLDAAARHGIPWTRVAEVLSSRPAAVNGLDDRKGRIAVGLDGDLTLVDPALRRTVTRDTIRSRAGRSVFEGATLTGWPVLTTLRGHVAAEDGKPVLGAFRGDLVARRTAS
ncbi:MAG: dihydroorotase family protein [Rhodospirillales bacterium]